MGTKITASWKNISFRLHGCSEDDTICVVESCSISGDVIVKSWLASGQGAIGSVLVALSRFFI